MSDGLCEQVSQRFGERFHEAVLVGVDGAREERDGIARGDENAVKRRVSLAGETGFSGGRDAFPADRTLLFCAQRNPAEAAVTQPRSFLVATETPDGKEKIEKVFSGSVEQG